MKPHKNHWANSKPNEFKGDPDPKLGSELEIPRILEVIEISKSVDENVPTLIGTEDPAYQIITIKAATKDESTN